MGLEPKHRIGVDLTIDDEVEFPQTKFSEFSDQHIRCLYDALCSQAGFHITNEQLIEELEDEFAHRGLDYDYAMGE